MVFSVNKKKIFSFVESQSMKLLSVSAFQCYSTIFVWPWNENARTKQKQQANGIKAIWLVYRTDSKARGFWLVKRTLGWKTLCPRTRNQSILRFDVMLQQDWPIEQRLLHIRVFFDGKTKSPCFDLFIHWLIKQMTNICRNHFSRSYENLSTKTLTALTRVKRRH